MHPIGTPELELVDWGRLIESFVLTDVQDPGYPAWIGRRDRHLSRKEAETTCEAPIWREALAGVLYMLAVLVWTHSG